MYPTPSCYLVVLPCIIASVIAASHGQGHGPRRRFNDGENTTTRDLELITDSPGPPTIQPGIPALQPSMPTSGIPSLSISPGHQAPSSATPDNLVSVLAGSKSSEAAAALPSTSVFSSLAINTISAPTVPLPTSSSTATSIPFLSELMSQLFAQSSTLTVMSSSCSATACSSLSSLPSSPATLTTSGTTADWPTPPVFGIDPKDGVPTASMNSVLVYSLSLPPYSGGLDTTGIAETLTATSPAEDKSQQLHATVYSFSLPPYTPKIPTYVATSAGLAPLSMTSGAPGNPAGNAPTNRIFLPQGSVDPTKNAPAIAASTLIPLYSPACLGNAYGGGYVFTPTVSATNSNATGGVIIPPAYGFTYKLEPVQSPVYSAAVVVVDTKAPTPSGPTSFSVSSAGNSGSIITANGHQPLNSLTQTASTITGQPTGASPTLGPTSVEIIASASPSAIPPITSRDAMTGVLSIVPVQGGTPNLSLAPTEGTIVAPEAMSSIIAALIDGFRGPSSPSGTASAVTVSSGSASNVISTEDASCTTITTLTTRTLVFTPSASAWASTVPQGLQHQRAAAPSNVSGPTSGDDLSALHFGPELNGTIILRGNASGVATFQGAAPTFSITSLLVFTVVIGVCVLVGNNMVMDE